MISLFVSAVGVQWCGAVLEDTEDAGYNSQHSTTATHQHWRWALWTVISITAVVAIYGVKLKV